MEKEIRQLINRFMDGLTTIDEERKIADYLCDNAVPDDMKRYKEMFAWFDNGMPLHHDDDNDKKYKKKPLLRTITNTVIISIAAAILTLIVMTWEHEKAENNNINNIIRLSQAEYTQQSDTIKNDSSINVRHEQKRKSRSTIRRYIMPIPKNLIAYHTSDSIRQAYNDMLEKDLEDICIKQEEVLNAMTEEYNKNISEIEMTFTAMQEEFMEPVIENY
ncbi:MAG: hypothetical protein ACI4V5_02445 [Prevotella sp.]